VLRFGQRARPQLPEVETVEQAVAILSYHYGSFASVSVDDRGMVVIKSTGLEPDIRDKRWFPDEAMQEANMVLHDRVVDKDLDEVTPTMLEEVLRILREHA